MNEKELFENFCFLPFWSDETEAAEKKVPYNYQRKDLTTLLAELEQIKNTIEDIKAKEWNLAKLMKFHKEGFSMK